jgi:D-lactate dehydrogenase
MVYAVRADEHSALKLQQDSLGIDLVLSEEAPSLRNIELLKGCEGVSILGQCYIDAELLDAWYNSGIRFISTRTIGYNHIDLEYAKKLGIRVCNASYAPNGVADFTVMMMLMCLRHYKQAMWRGHVNDFALTGLQGREMKDMTVGIIGAGKIGAQVIKNLSGFGCKILCFAHRPNPAISDYVEYVDFDKLLSDSDIISIHVPLRDDNWHMIDRENISKMKDGVILINCSRGELMDIEALIDGIESQKIGALGMDTAEGEEGIIHEDHRTDILSNRNWFYLHQFRNVIMTQHMAFYTDAAVDSMVKCGIQGIWEMANNQYCETEL